MHTRPAPGRLPQERGTFSTNAFIVLPSYQHKDGMDEWMENEICEHNEFTRIGNSG